MRIVFKNAALVFAKAVWNATGKIIKVASNDAAAVTLPSNASVYSRNLVDINKLKLYTILNDAGVEVADSSSYFDHFIPVDGGTTLRSNCNFSRVYLYDKDKNLLLRYGVSILPYFEVPAQYNGIDVVYVKIQTASYTKDILRTMIVTMGETSEPTEFEEFRSNNTGEIYSPYSWVWADDLSEISISSK